MQIQFHSQPSLIIFTKGGNNSDQYCIYIYIYIYIYILTQYWLHVKTNFITFAEELTVLLSLFQISKAHCLIVLLTFAS